MQELDKILEHVELACKARGKKLTTKRKLILRALIDLDKSVSAYELIDYCKEKLGLNLQAMSVYRILEFLESEHLAHKMKVSNKYVACSHLLQDKEHGIPQFFICSKCDKISEQTIEPAMIIGLQSSAKVEGFTLNSPQLEISGVCEACAKEEARQSASGKEPLNQE